MPKLHWPRVALPDRPLAALSRAGQGILALWGLAIASLVGAPFALALAVGLSIRLALPAGTPTRLAACRLGLAAAYALAFLALGSISRTGAVPALLAFAPALAWLVATRRSGLEQEWVSLPY